MNMQLVRQTIKKLTLESFLRNVMVLAGGTLISQVIVLATLPILTHIYSPADYGTYSVFISVIAMLLMVVSLSYEYAITLPEADEEASTILRLSLFICVGVSILSGVGIYALYDPITHHWTNQPHLRSYFIIFSLCLFAAGCYQILSYWSIRKKYFKQLARAKYTQSGSQVLSQLFLSIFHLGPLGLIIGDTLGRAAGLIPQWKLWRRDVKEQAMETTWEDMKEGAYRYRRFPLLASAANVLNSVGLYLPNIMLAAFYGPQVAGWFTLGQRILGSPMTLIGTSVTQVYLSEVSRRIHQDPDKLYSLFLKTVRNVFLFGLVVVIVLDLFAPPLFALFFGSEWQKSGEFMRILSFMYLAQFVANSVGITIDVMERQDLHLYREIARTMIVLFAIFLAHFLHRSAEIAIVYLSIAGTIGYLLHLGLSWYSARRFMRMNKQADDTNEGS